MRALHISLGSVVPADVGMAVTCGGQVAGRHSDEVGLSWGGGGGGGGRGSVPIRGPSTLKWDTSYFGLATVFSPGTPPVCKPPPLLF